MTAATGRPRLEMFPLPPWIEPDEAPGLTPGDSCGPGCGCGPAAPPDMDRELQSFRDAHGDDVELQVIGYDGDEALAGAVARLDTIFTDSGQPMRVSVDNFDELMRLMGPFVAIEGRLVHAGLVPTEPQLSFLLQRALEARAASADGD